MTVEFQLTQQEFFKAQLLHLRPKPLVRLLFYLLGALFAGVVVYYFWLIAQNRPLPTGWWFLPLGLAYGALLYFFILPWRVGKIYRQNPSIAAPMRLNFSDEGMGLRSPRGELTLPWKSLQKWKMNRDVLLLYHSGPHFQPVPARACGQRENYVALLRLVAKHLGPAQP